MVEEQSQHNISGTSPERQGVSGSGGGRETQGFHKEEVRA